GSCVLQSGPMAAGAPAFKGRAGELATLDRLLDDVRAGASAVVVIRGDAGIGKSTALQHLAPQADGCRLVQISAVEPEFDRAFAALHPPCTPILDALPRRPEPAPRAL